MFAIKTEVSDPRAETFQPSAPPSGLFLESITYQGEVSDRPLEPIARVVTHLPRRVKS